MLVGSILWVSHMGDQSSSDFRMEMSLLKDGAPKQMSQFELDVLS